MCGQLLLLANAATTQVAAAVLSHQLDHDARLLVLDVDAAVGGTLRLLAPRRHVSELSGRRGRVDQRLAAE